jgi:Ricin-type beta-trefoil lectin domain
MVVGWISRIALATLALVAVMAGSLVAAGGASAQEGPLLIRSKTNGGCLRTASNGQVSLLPCRDADRTQHWVRWQNGWTKSVAFGYCLVSTDTEEAVRATARCSQTDRTQWWSHHPDRTGWGRYAQNDSAGREQCLTPLGSEVTLVIMGSGGPCLGEREKWKKFFL